MIKEFLDVLDGGEMFGPGSQYVDMMMVFQIWETRTWIELMRIVLMLYCKLTHLRLMLDLHILRCQQFHVNPLR